MGVEGSQGSGCSAWSLGLRIPGVLVLVEIQGCGQEDENWAFFVSMR